MTIEFTQTMEHVNDFAMHHWRKHTMRRMVFYWLIICSIMTLLFVGLSSEPMTTADWIMYPVVIVIVVIIWRIITPMMLRLRYNSNKDKSIWTGSRKLELMDDGIRSISERVDTVYKWHSITRYEESKKNYLLYISSVQALLIPKDVFLTQEERNQFFQILAQHGISKDNKK
ncbi:MAG: YcxB family protein [Bacteroidota bacterium]